MNKRLFMGIVAVVLALSGMFCIMSSAGCTETNFQKQQNSTGHVVNPDGMGGEDVLDDGGGINSSEPVLTAVGVNTSGEHRIILGEDTENYELYGNATLAEWSNSGFTFNRVRCNKDDNGEYGVIFKFDTGGISDISKVGFMVTLIYSRAYTCISVSTDRENWTDIGYGEDNGVKADYAERVTELLGNAVSDGNLYQCYYSLGEYAKSGSPLYIKCGYSADYPNALASPAGTDVIAYASFYDSCEVKYEYL